MMGVLLCPDIGGGSRGISARPVRPRRRWRRTLSTNLRPARPGWPVSNQAAGITLWLSRNMLAGS
jgi:hypothetical protein